MLRTPSPTDRIRRSAGAARLLAALLLLGLLVPAAGAAAEAPTEVVRTTVDQVLGVLNDTSLDPQVRRGKIEDIAYARFDFDTMSKLVVARYWKTFTPEQKAEFIDEFKSFLAHTYGERIDRYSDEEVVVVGETPMKRGDVKVLTKIVGGDFGGALVEYRLRQGDDGAWRVIDVKVEGISLVLNYRDQFKTLLSRGGPDELLQQLKKKNTEI